VVLHLEMTRGNEVLKEIGKRKGSGRSRSAEEGKSFGRKKICGTSWNDLKVRGGGISILGGNLTMLVTSTVVISGMTIADSVMAPEKTVAFR
jgi:hypothetical protein